MTLSYEAHPSWVVSGDATYLDVEHESLTLPRRLAARFYAGSQLILEAWDKPSSREYNVCFEDGDNKALYHIRGQAVAYEHGPWMASQAYSVGDKIVAGTFPSIHWYWRCNRAGTSGIALPSQLSEPLIVHVASDSRYLAESGRVALTGSAVDNGDGTVTLEVSTGPHIFAAGNEVRINGSINYDGLHTLPDQAAGDDTHVILTGAFAAETFDGNQSVWLSAAEAVDLGDGLVKIPCVEHARIAGEVIKIDGTEHYTGVEYTLPDQAQGDADHLVITAAYQPEGFHGDDKLYLATGAIADNGDGTVSLPAPGHGRVAGDVITIRGTANYDGVHALPDQAAGDADHLVVSAPYALEYLDGSEFFVVAVEDPDGSGVQWAYVWDAVDVLESEPTGRIIGRVNSGRLRRSGTRFPLGHGDT